MSPFQMRYQRSWRDTQRQTGNKSWHICVIVLALLMTGFGANAEIPVTLEQTEAPVDTLDPLTLVETKIIDAALYWGVDAQTALKIARCESNLDPFASNPNSTAKGLYQFTDTTWEWINAPRHQYDMDENIRQFMVWYQVYPSWWSTSQMCWNK